MSMLGHVGRWSVGVIAGALILAAVSLVTSPSTESVLVDALGAGANSLPLTDVKSFVLRRLPERCVAVKFRATLADAEDVGRRVGPQAPVQNNKASILAFWQVAGPAWYTPDELNNFRYWSNGFPSIGLGKCFCWDIDTNVGYLFIIYH